VVIVMVVVVAVVTVIVMVEVVAVVAVVVKTMDTITMLANCNRHLSPSSPKTSPCPVSPHPPPPQVTSAGWFLLSVDLGSGQVSHQQPLKWPGKPDLLVCLA
jgi:hypothetical protein